MDRQFPYNITSELGEVQFFEKMCPGVYFVSCAPKGESGWCREFYLVELDSPAIPASVKKMGRQLEEAPGLLAYALEDVSGGQKPVEYEAARFCFTHGPPLSGGVTLRSIAVDGMETNPEYFESYPVPIRTPWGHTLRHKAIDNGVYWIETERCQRVLAVCYILHDELSDFARRLAVLERWDQEDGLDETMGKCWENGIFPLSNLSRKCYHSGYRGTILLTFYSPKKKEFIMNKKIVQLTGEQIAYGFSCVLESVFTREQP